jgi:hypothetical protein
MLNAKQAYQEDKIRILEHNNKALLEAAKEANRFLNKVDGKEKIPLMNKLYRAIAQAEGK